MPFLTAPDLKPILKKQWLLRDELVYGMTSGKELIIQPGLVTDLASIPWFMRPFYPVNGLHRYSSALHDGLYQENGVSNIGTFTREACDHIFLEAMESQGVGEFRRNSMFKGVDYFGWIAWNKHKRRIAKAAISN